MHVRLMSLRHFSVIITFVLGLSNFVSCEEDNDNIVSADSAGSLILSGRDNRIESDSDFSVVAGGASNKATGDYAFVVGASNLVSSNFATVPGGFRNEATGRFAAALGGSNNIASGRNSVAMGKYAHSKEPYSAAMGFSDHACETNEAHSFKICTGKLKLEADEITIKPSSPDSPEVSLGDYVGKLIDDKFATSENFITSKHLADGSVTGSKIANYGLYKRDIYITGESHQCYPIVLFPPGGHMQTLVISRAYHEQGPDDWSTSSNSKTHKGQLFVRVRLNGGMWGGQRMTLDVQRHTWLYAPTFCKIEHVAHTIGVAIWLRGGDSVGAKYTIESTWDTTATNIRFPVLGEVIYEDGTLIFRHSEDNKDYDKFISPIRDGLTLSNGNYNLDAFFKEVNPNSNVAYGADMENLHLLGNYGLYKRDVTMYGDSDKCYPIVLRPPGGHMQTLVLSRAYHEQGPEDWSTASNANTHKGQLFVRVRLNGGMWGGQQMTLDVQRHTWVYAPTFCDIKHCAHTIGVCAFLRGGGSGGAKYTLEATWDLSPDSSSRFPILAQPIYTKTLIFRNSAATPTYDVYESPLTDKLTTDSGQYDISKFFKGVNPQSDSLYGIENEQIATLDNYGLYSIDFIMKGETDECYPIILYPPSAHMQRVIISRMYNEQGPDDWHTAGYSDTHKATLFVDVHVNGGMWGGQRLTLDVKRHTWQYSKTFCDIKHAGHNMGLAIWLRGGGSDGAKYTIETSWSTVKGYKYRAFVKLNEPIYDDNFEFFTLKADKNPDYDKYTQTISPIRSGLVDSSGQYIASAFYKDINPQSDTMFGLDNSFLNTLQNYGLYAKTIIMKGKSDECYPIIVYPPSAHMQRVIISRMYHEQGPDDWHTAGHSATHKATLFVDLHVNGGMWGGQRLTLDVKRHTWAYSKTFCKVEHFGHSMGLAVWLRGGGEGGAKYTFETSWDMDNAYKYRAFVKLYEPIYDDNFKGFTLKGDNNPAYDKYDVPISPIRSGLVDSSGQYIASAFYKDINPQSNTNYG
jgi:hypothetical protein